MDNEETPQVTIPAWKGIQPFLSVRGQPRFWDDDDVDDDVDDDDDDDNIPPSTGSNIVPERSNNLLTIPVVGNRLAVLDYKHQGIVGTPLAHVVSIKINTFNERCQLHGEIRVEDVQGTVGCLFNLERNNSILVSPSSSDISLLLCQNSRAISAYPFFKVHFDLKDGDSELLKSSFKFSWNANKTDNVNDNLLTETIPGKRGFATISYIVHSHAIECHIVGRFKNSETDSSSFPIHGRMIARYKDVSHSDAIIFEGTIEMGDEKIFFPHRSVLTVPTTYPLQIEVDFRDPQGRTTNAIVEFSSGEIDYNIHKEINVLNGELKLTLYEVNYGKMSIGELEARKSDWRRCGMIADCGESDDGLSFDELLSLIQCRD